ncbi:MAG TPA: hypothetical protein VIW80_13810 [Pyrinomonadaceae bacterium]|jgi:hypothetical protein
MTQRRFIEEIKQLSVSERIALLEEISRSLLEDLEARVGDVQSPYVEIPETDVQSARELKMAAVRRLRGVLKMSGHTPSDEELKDDYAHYLTEKYS